MEERKMACHPIFLFSIFLSLGLPSLGRSEALDYHPCDRRDDLAFVGVIDGEGYQNDPGAVGQLDPVSWRVTF